MLPTIDVALARNPPPSPGPREEAKQFWHGLVIRLMLSSSMETHASQCDRRLGSCDPIQLLECCKRAGGMFAQGAG